MQQNGLIQNDKRLRYSGRSASRGGNIDVVTLGQMFYV